MLRLRAPLEIFLWSRAAIWITTLLAYSVFEAQFAQPLHAPTAAPPSPAGDGWAIDLWARWDGGWFTQVAQSGYGDPKTTTAFFPAYPLIVRAAGWLLGGHDVVAGVLVSLAACAVAFVLLYALARELVGEEAARRSVVYLAIFPAALFLGAVYGESLYLLLTVAAFLCATRGRWSYAGTCVGLAILTRPTGVMLLPALAVLAWHAVRRRRAFAGLGLALPIAAAWPLWLWAVFGHPFEFLTAERNEWHRRLSPAGPFGGIWKGVDAGWQGLLQFVAGGNRFPGTSDSLQAAGLNLEALAAAVFVIVLGVVAWRRLGAAYGVFALASVALPLASPAANFPLLSMPRFALGIFPVFIALGAIARPRTNTIVIAVFAIWLGVDLARWVEWQFVA
ncbi:MAG TPA: glycosyltransferase family 39 protein [Gaiellaceae bacterium]|jgi:4-amino-4-deoxy-L-arabinose transferase-like glycosyltransferase